MNKLFIHIGIHKTASSSIQLELHRRNSLLESLGVHYPEKWRFNHNFLYGMFCDSPELFYENVFASRSASEILEYYKLLDEQYSDEIERVDCNKFLVSAEDLSVLKAHEIKRLKEYFLDKFNGRVEFNIVVFVRNPISFVTSDIQQSIKTGFNMDVKRYQNIFFDRISPYIECFGRENIHVIDFDRVKKEEKGPLGALLNSVGVEDTTQFNSIHINEAYSDIAIDIIEFINDNSPKVIGGKLSEKRTNNDVDVFGNLKGSAYTLSESDANKIRMACRLDCKWLRNNFGISYEIDHIPRSSTLDYTGLKDFYKKYFDSMTEDIQKLSIVYLLESFGKEHESDFIFETLSVIFNKFYYEVRNLKFGTSFIKSTNMNFTADLVREYAYGSERDGDINKAYKLMSLALELRPEGEFIMSKLNEYRAIMSEKGRS